jgi:membrane protein DedA with SNARE-associated domain
MALSPTPVLLGGIVQWVTGVVDALGYPGIAILIALESVILPIPSEVILPFVGFSAEQGRFSLAGAIIAATIGSVVGALILYVLGARLGETRVRSFVGRYGRYVGSNVRDLERAEVWFDHHGAATILFGRLVPVIRSFVSVPAGLRRMPVLRFTLYTAVGSAIWNALLIVLGWVLGNQWHQVGQYSSYVEYAVIAALVIGLAYFIWRRRFAHSHTAP